METFYRNSDIVLSYLSESLGKHATYWLVHSCLKQLGGFLETNSQNYSKASAQEWLKKQEKSKSTLQTYSKALRQLEDVYQAGHVSFFNRSHSAMVLAGAFDDLITRFLLEISSSHTASHLANIRNRCRFFFGYMKMDCHCSTPEAMTYDDILAFYNAVAANLSKADRCMYKGTIMNLLSWMSREQICPAGFSMLLFMNRAEKAVMLQNLPSEARIQIEGIGASCYNDFPPEEFYEAALEFRRDLEALGYADTMKLSAKATFDLLFLFLDMNHLGYDPSVAKLWFDHAGYSCFGSNMKMSRRLLALFEAFTEEGVVRPENTFVYKPLLCDSLPEWCQDVLHPFLEQKRREHKAASTVCMYRSSITQFCAFLVREGISSFSQVDAKLLKKFNLTDPHKTAEGKNAYNVRIRKFLFYLAQNGYVGNYYLGEALPCTVASKTRIVEVLSEEESMILENYRLNHFSCGIALMSNALLNSDN